MNFRLTHRLIAAVVFIISAVQFFVTGQPSVSFWDPGEISAAAYGLQVPHPPGGPLFLLVGRFFYMLPFPGDLGLRMNVVSFLSSAFSVLFLYLIAVKLINTYKGREPQNPLEAWGTYLSAAIGALAFSFSDTFWFSGVESNYFAASTLLFSAVVWLMMDWHEKADQPHAARYLIMIAYLIGLSAGVHLMSVLTIVSVAMVFIFRKYVEDDEACRKSWYLFLVHAAVLLFIALVMWNGEVTTRPPSPDETHLYDLKFIRTMLIVSAIIVGIFWKRVFTRNSFYFPIAFGAIALGIAYPGIIKILPTSLLKLAQDDIELGLFILIAFLGLLGYAAWWFAKHQRNVLSMAIVAVMMVIFGFTTYTMIVIRANKGTPMNENNPRTFSGLVTYLNREQYGDFPMFKRRWSSEAHHAGIYDAKKYPTDLSFFWKYQMDHMFNRYVFWNFIGRESFEQDAGVDWSKLFGIPFVLGLLGVYFHFRKDWKMASVFLLLFIFMGYLIAFYQNQQESQPRERDYFYPGAYFVFALWIALGIRGLLDLLEEKIGAKPSFRPAMIGVLALGALFVPLRMLQVNYHTHDRSRNWVPYDFSYNMLQSCAPNSILFTNGDNDTFPLWFLQDVKGIRRDVRIVNLSLVNTGWYIRQMKYAEPYGDAKIDMSLSDEAIDRLARNGLAQWDPQVITVPVSDSAIAQYGVTDTSVIRTKSISFTMPNTMQFGKVKVIRVQDVMVREIVEHNTWMRPIYFALTCAEDSKIGLGDYLEMEGLAQRLVPQKKPYDRSIEYVNEPVLRANLFDDSQEYSDTYRPGFKYRGLSDKRVFLDENETNLTRNYRSSYIRLALYYLYADKDSARCVKSLDRMELVMPRDVVDMDYRLAFDIANIYNAAGATGKFREMTQDVEKVALQKLAENPTDVSSYYNPYVILTEIYDRNGEYDKAAAVLERLVPYYPKDANLQKRIQYYRSFSGAGKDTAAAHPQ